MTHPVRLRSVVGSVLVPLALVSCAKKDQPPPPPAQSQAPPSAAPPATTLPASPTPLPTPPPVWRTTHWGMTKKEVLAALPGEAVRLPKAADFAQPQPGSSLLKGSGDLAIPSYEADGATFRALFGFEKDALQRVHLSALKPSPHTCGDVEKALTTRHAEPAQRGATGTSLKGQEITWKLPDQTIVLTCGGVASLGFSTVTLDYMAPSP